MGKKQKGAENEDMQKERRGKKEIKRCWQSSAVESASLESARTQKALDSDQVPIATLAHLTPSASFHILSPTNK